MLQIRRPTLHDLNDCVRLDSSYTTQRVWQMSLDVEAHDIQSNFHLIYLPRPVTFTIAPVTENLLQCWQRGDCLLAARMQRPETTQDALVGSALVGFIHLLPDPQTRSGRIVHHAIAPDHRRRGIGGRLLQAAIRWAREHNLHSATVEVPTKNHPAISFYMEQGFTFTGFHERTYGDQEIIFQLARSTLR